MKRRVLALFLLFLVLGAPYAFPSEDSARSAFLFAERRDWDNARAHARRSENSALRKLIEWEYLQDQDSGASFGEISEFLQKNPDWPRQERLKLRAEQSLRISDAPDAQLQEWFATNPPVSGTGKVKYAELLVRRGTTLTDGKVRFLLRDAWRNGDFDENEETRLLTVYRDILREEDHIIRADRLLWEEKTKPAKRMLALVPEPQQKLARARMALMDDAKDSNFYLSHVPNSLRNDPGLLYARMLYRARRSDSNGVREMLLAAPAPVPYPEKWWRWRQVQVREAIGNREYPLARQLLANHSQNAAHEQAEAIWLTGWLALEFGGRTQDAYDAFYRMFNDVRFPVSKARAAYWLARAAEKAGDKDAAQGWYATAAAYPTTFYGQLAYASIHPGEPLVLPADPDISSRMREHLAGNDIVRAVKLAMNAGDKDIATELLYHLVDHAEGTENAALAAEIGNEMLGVRTAKRALQKNVVLLRAGYPRPRPPSDIDIEPALALAVARQESEFDTYAKSRSGALGLMQLLPRTAREQAKKSGLGYTESRLYERDYNLRLGSAYLARLLAAYDGNYVLAIAAYNAGPGNVREWMNAFGAPRGSVHDAVNWIEKIPFEETRNYVLRVMENVSVYRQILAEKTKPALALDDDLVR